jgi:hypothetical protein
MLTTVARPSENAIYGLTNDSKLMAQINVTTSRIQDRTTSSPPTGELAATPSGTFPVLITKQFLHKPNSSSLVHSRYNPSSRTHRQAAHLPWLTGSPAGARSISSFRLPATSSQVRQNSTNRHQPTAPKGQARHDTTRWTRQRLGESGRPPSLRSSPRATSACSR